MGGRKVIDTVGIGGGKQCGHRAAPTDTRGLAVAVLWALGYLIGGVDFTQLAVTLPAIKEGAEAVTIRYGVFLQALFDFVIVAFAIFMIVKLINRVRRKEEAAPAPPAAPPRQEVLLEEIRDLLKKQG